MAPCPRCGFEHPLNVACPTMSGTQTRANPPGAEPFAAGRGNLVGALVGGKYRLRDVIGRGGNGTVYEAFDEGMARSVAVKIPTIDPRHGQIPLKRFLREARTAGAISHPHVAAVHDFGMLQDGTPFLVMERLLGESLARRMRRKRKLPVSEAVAITMQLLSGLHGSHMRRFVHRDMKPGNIFLARVEGYENFVKILDFGTSKLIGAKDEDDSAYREELTTAGMVLGTPYYMAPEQVGGGELDGRADLFSAGIVFYEMLTGERPFAGENSQVVFMKILAADGLSVRYVDPSLPKAVDEIIFTATRKRVDERYESAAVFRKTLEGLSLATVPEEDELQADAAVPPTIRQDPPKVVEEVSQARLDELKKRFHELAVLHRGTKPKARRPVPDTRTTHDSEIPITYEPSASDRPPPAPDIEEHTEKRERIPRLTGDEDIEGMAPTKPRGHGA
ncbi:MAG: serine/threonine-protein kinase [Polyangiaceae bacterium]